jgi:pyruvate dehydrogenase E2 component (dihydrolipoamide acetyltransferase)
MALIINMPQLSDTMEEGRILQWLKSEGDHLGVGDIIAEIESDKADVEFEVFRAGVLHKIIVPEGEVAPVGAPIAIVGAEDEDVSDALAQAQETGAVAAEKVAVEVAQKEETAKVRAEEEEKARAKVQEQVKAEAAREPTEGLKASPVALRLAAELGVDLSAVEGSGPGGRIVKRDVEAASRAPAPRAAEVSEAEAPPKKKPPKKEPAPTAAPSPEDAEEVVLSGMRKAIARRLVESKAPVPHFYVTSQVEMGQAMEAKDALKRLREIKVTVTDMLIKACGLALIKHPQINSSYQGEVARRYKEAHIGVVVATEEGLIIPVVRGAQGKTLAEVSAETVDLIERGRKRKLKPEEYSGATFTISNLGMYGVEEFSAVISPPQGAILAVGSIMERPVAKEGSLSVGKTMKLNLACDHRIIDGTAAAAFLNEVKELLEHPAALLL